MYRADAEPGQYHRQDVAEHLRPAPPALLDALQFLVQRGRFGLVFGPRQLPYSGLEVGQLHACGTVVFPVEGRELVEDVVTALEPRDTYSNLFADRKVELRFTVKSARAWRGKAAWSLAAENDRTLARGEEVVRAAAGKAEEVTIALRSPTVRPGVVLKTRLRVRLSAGARKPLATCERILWIFPEDPFVNQRQWLKGLKIALFDPEKTTAGPLKKLDVPFDEINTVAALGAVEEGLLLVGAGLSFKDFPDLGKTLERAAAAGRPVLCLAPAGGVLAVPGMTARGPRPRTLRWGRSDHITALDRRLDATAWPPDGKVVAARLVLKAETGAVVAEVVQGADGWPWFEAEFPARKGRLLVCGFGLMGKAWDASPTPRYLFARLLEVLDGKTETKASQDKETNR